MLTPAQIDHYRAFGFVVLRGYFSPDEVSALRRESVEELDRQHRHQPFDGSLRHWCCMNDDERVPLSARLLEDERFLGVAEQLHGKVLPVWCDANRYVHALTGWHPDYGADEVWTLERAGVKFLHYLEPLTAATGALRVIPGSHRSPLHEAVRRHIDEHGPRPEDVPAVVCETRPGDVVAFTISLWHAAIGGGRDRRLSTVAYHQHPETAAEVSRLRAGLHAQVEDHRRTFGWRGEVFPRAWIERAAHDERRRRVVELIHSAGVFAAMGADAEAAEAALRAPAASPR
jgi:hypothetical protein